ncbi:hypothetical protein ADK60_16025 [Streptomyces sp. XY431]|uniref:hypothetical protein n=1 Tax=Streptomyces sp. XY431 TaxID=1415562 RepID=UPI0006AF0E57|nr:hypothetical protein [Streptomyces sp. XY431]KOV30834.1 hypothetical protein ADK60_16025 [Streptomyces sp. XY431]
MNSSPIDDSEPPEHRRYAQYLRALESVAEAEEADLLAAVLRDEDQSMAEAAVNQHLERRAAEQLTGPGFPAWAEMMAVVVGGRAFLVRRLREWTLLRSLALDEPWTEEELLTASDWFQRTVTTTRSVTSPAALGLLAERGRTRRVRNAASRRG